MMLRGEVRRKNHAKIDDEDDVVGMQEELFFFQRISGHSVSGLWCVETRFASVMVVDGNVVVMFTEYRIRDSAIRETH